MSWLPDFRPAELAGIIATLSKDERAALYEKYTQMLHALAASATPSDLRPIEAVMKEAPVRPGARFALVCIAGAGLAWLGGFNFDQRGLGVAFISLFVCVLGVLAEAHAAFRREYP